MTISARSYLTAGVAAVGAGAMALTPIQALPAQQAVASERAVSTMAVQLASSIDPITPWVNTLTTAGKNIQVLIDFYLAPPGPLPIAQTVWTNLGIYMKEDAATVSQQIQDNIKTFFLAPWSAGECAQFCDAPLDDPNAPKPFYDGQYISGASIVDTSIPFFTLSPRDVYAILPNVLIPIVDGVPDYTKYNQLAPLLQLAATPWSGQLASVIGPVLGPLISVSQSLKAASAFFGDGDTTGAINELINIPANMTNALWNGAGPLDLTDIAKGLLPEEITKIGINLGGLVSAPTIFNGTVAKPTGYSGGTLFDALSFEASADILGTGKPITATDPGQLPSFAGGAIGLGQLLGQELKVTPVYPVEPGQAVAPAASAPVDVPVVDVPAEDPAPAVEVSAPATGRGSDNGAAADAGGSDNGGGHTRAARTGRG